jgi:hypothetical protein
MPKFVFVKFVFVPLAEVVLPFLAPLMKFSAVTAIPMPIGSVVPATVVVVRITIVIDVSGRHRLCRDRHIHSRAIYTSTRRPQHRHCEQLVQ